MQTITAFAKRFNLSRTTLLYYDRIGLLKPAGFSPAGYRLYGRQEMERMKRIDTFRNAGLALKEIRKILDDENTDNLERVLEDRLTALNDKIAELRAQQCLVTRLLSRDHDQAGYRMVDATQWVAMLDEIGVDEVGRRCWHHAFERDAPDMHHEFLCRLGFDDKEIDDIRRQSQEGS